MLDFREITLSDVDKVLEIEEECFAAPWKRDDFVDLATKDDRTYLVMTLDGEIIGGAAIRNIVGEGEITNVEITEGKRSCGYSHELMKALLKKGKEMGCSAFTLEVRKSNMPARKCYEGAGFLEEGIRPNFYSNPKEDAVIMWIRDISKVIID